MAKDPAMLWYWSDWHSGTITLSRFLKGCYMDLLHAQFNSGHLSLEEVKTVLGSDFGTAWPALQKKFRVDDTGNFFNERLDVEKTKRANFTASRRKNLESSHMEPHTGQHTGRRMENENENRIVDEIRDSIKKESVKNVSREPSDETLQDVEYWTKDVLDGNDALFLNMVRHQNIILNGQLEPLARDHLGKCARYNWHERITTQQAFRHSLLNYIIENIKTKESKNGKSKVSLEDLQKFRKGNV